MDIVVVDLAGVVRAEAEPLSLSLTPTLNSFAELVCSFDPNGRAAREIVIGGRALKVYDEGELLFHGQVWEPLKRTNDLLEVTARSPLAILPWRRVQATAAYAAVDAGAIVKARVDAQNARRATGLRVLAGNVAASVVRTRTYLPGQREDEIVNELADLADGFFYVDLPVDGVAGVFADLHVRWPDAGVERPDVRFEYGAGTLDSVNGYELVEMLPLNRVTAAGIAGLGGRVAQVKEDAASIAALGLFEDELAYTEVGELPLLLAAATGQLRPAAPMTLQLTPGPDAPLLYADFDVGDFVRVRILEPSEPGPGDPNPAPAVDLTAWVRVVSATLDEDANGIRTLSSLTLEMTSGQIDSRPSELWRRRFDDERRRLEALERRVELIDAAAEAAPAAPAPDGGVPPDVEPPPDPPPPVEPPPPAPPEPPSLSGLAAGGVSTTAIEATFDVAENGTPTETTVSAILGGVVKSIVGPFYGGGRFTAHLAGLVRNTTYQIHVHAGSGSGVDDAEVNATTLDYSGGWQAE